MSKNHSLRGPVIAWWRRGDDDDDDDDDDDSRFLADTIPLIGIPLILCVALVYQSHTILKFPLILRVTLIYQSHTILKFAYETFFRDITILKKFQLQSLFYFLWVFFKQMKYDFIAKDKMNTSWPQVA